MIDKYIGDSVMAVWGGLSRMEDHADHAMRAALAIAQVIREDNAVRRAAGQPPIRVRIGLHSGPVVVGNIGAPGRVNFTVVGDTVNIAQRFEQLGKEFMARRRGGRRAGERRHHGRGQGPRRAGHRACRRPSCARSRATTSRSRSIVWCDALDGTPPSTASVPTCVIGVLKKGELMKRRHLLGLSAMVLALGPAHAAAGAGRQEGQLHRRAARPDPGADRALSRRLLAQTLMAASYPLEVVEAARWSQANPNLKGDARSPRSRTRTGMSA